MDAKDLPEGRKLMMMIQIIYIYIYTQSVKPTRDNLAPHYFCAPRRMAVTDIQEQCHLVIAHRINQKVCRFQNLVNYQDKCNRTEPVALNMQAD